MLSFQKEIFAATGVYQLLVWIGMTKTRLLFPQPISNQML